jgi:hypothetical protein
VNHVGRLVGWKPRSQRDIPVTHLLPRSAVALNTDRAMSEPGTETMRNLRRQITKSEKDTTD